MSKKDVHEIHTATSPAEKVARCGTRFFTSLRIVAPHDDPRWCVTCRDTPRPTEEMAITGRGEAKVMPVLLNVPQPLLCEVYNE